MKGARLVHRSTPLAGSHLHPHPPPSCRKSPSSPPRLSRPRQPQQPPSNRTLPFRVARHTFRRSAKRNNTATEAINLEGRSSRRGSRRARSSKGIPATGLRLFHGNPETMQAYVEQALYECSRRRSACVGDPIKLTMPPAQTNHWLLRATRRTVGTQPPAHSSRCARSHSA